MGLPAGQKKVKILKRLQIIEAFRLSGNKPEWMILDAVPVIPPDLRPMIMLDGGQITQHLTSTTFTDVLSTETTVLKECLNSMLLTSS